MRQIVCDRCKKTVALSDEEKVREIALVDRDHGKMDDLGDLCAQCLGALRDWLRPQRAKRRER